MILYTTAQSLTLQASANPGATVPCKVKFRLVIDQQRIEKPELFHLQNQSSQLASGDTVAVTVCSAPSTGQRKEIVEVFFQNKGTAQNTFTFSEADSAATPTSTPLIWTLAPGDGAFYHENRGWYFKDKYGHEKITMVP